MSMASPLVRSVRLPADRRSPAEAGHYVHPRMLAVVFILTIGSPASAQVQLPDGPGKDVAERLCSVCHEAERAASVRLTREGLFVSDALWPHFLRA